MSYTSYVCPFVLIIKQHQKPYTHVYLSLLMTGLKRLKYVWRSFHKLHLSCSSSSNLCKPASLHWSNTHVVNGKSKFVLLLNHSTCVTSGELNKVSYSRKTTKKNQSMRSPSDSTQMTERWLILVSYYPVILTAASNSSDTCSIITILRLNFWTEVQLLL